MDDLRWDDLRSFLAVAREGTLAAGAEVLEVNPSTLHRRIAALEQSLGAQLFERDPRGYALTSVGEALLPRAQEVEEAVLALRRTATGHDRTARGPVTLTLPESLLGVVAPALAEVQVQCPGLRPVLRAEERMLDLGVDADIALRPSDTPPEAAVGRRVGTIGFAVYGPSRCEDEELPWVIYCEGSGPRAASAWWHREHGDAPVLMEASGVSPLHRILVCTRAQGILPCHLGDPDPRLVRRSDVIEAADTQLWLLLHADLRRSARVRALMDLLQPALEQAAPLLSGRSVPGEP